MRGIFIAVEGPDGSGKTTQAKILDKKLRSLGREVVTVREPGGTHLGERVRQVLLDPDGGEISVRAELMLFMAARAQLVEDIIAPALSEGKIILSDRFILSTLVYQGVAGGLPLEDIYATGRIATGGILPGLNIVIDVPAEIGMARVGSERDRMESKGLEFHKKIREGYLEAAKLVDGAVVLDGTQSVGKVSDMVWQEVERALR